MNPVFLTKFCRSNSLLYLLDCSPAFSTKNIIELSKIP